MSRPLLKCGGYIVHAGLNLLSSSFHFSIVHLLFLRSHMEIPHLQENLVHMSMLLSRDSHLELAVIYQTRIELLPRVKVVFVRVSANVYGSSPGIYVVTFTFICISALEVRMVILPKLLLFFSSLLPVHPVQEIILFLFLFVPVLFHLVS